MKRNSILMVLALALVFAVPSFAEVTMVANGIDTWVTPGDGSSYLDLSSTPIPAGFLCAQSRPFADRIVWQGKPIASAPDGVLGEADTIVQRLDDVVFDENGMGTTRLQVRALSLVAMQPIRTRCGLFEVSATLNGEQPITSMEIARTTKTAGVYQASLALNVKLEFTPVGKGLNRAGGVKTFIVDTPMHLESDLTRWDSVAPAPEKVGQIGGFVVVDTDGDAITDTFLPGQSSFFSLGNALDGEKGLTNKCIPPTPAHSCHADPTTGKCHCTTCQCLP